MRREASSLSMSSSIYLHSLYLPTNPSIGISVSVSVNCCTVPHLLGIIVQEELQSAESFRRSSAYFISVITQALVKELTVTDDDDYYVCDQSQDKTE